MAPLHVKPGAPRATLRDVRSEDQAFLRALYGDTRAEEMAATGWDDDRIAAFLDDQFSLQTQHYQAHFGANGHAIVEVRGRPIGRIWVHDADDHRLLVDIAILATDRRRGHGEALVRKVLAGARRRVVPVRLHVLAWNTGARDLYHRLGFVVTGLEGERLAMEWRPSSAPS